MRLLQIETLLKLLDSDSVTIVGLLLVVCGFLIWHTVRQEKKFSKLVESSTETLRVINEQHIKEEKDNKILLVDLVTKNISAMEKIKTTIDNIKDGL
jgi:hypothetical protein